MLNQPSSKQEINQLLRTILPAVQTALDNVGELKLLFDSIPDADFTEVGGGYEYTQQEVNDFKAAVTDLNKLRLIAEAQDVQAAPNDFYFNAKKVWGFNPVRR